MFLSSGAPVPAAVDTLADRTPMWSHGAYYATESLPLLGHWAAYAAIYKTQLWVGVLVNKLASATARLPLQVRQAADGGDKLAESTHPLVELLNRPAPHLDAVRLWLWTSSTFDIYGEAFWLKLRDDNGRVRELMPMHPSNVIVRRLDDGALAYVYAAGVRNVSELPPLADDDVVPFLAYNPDTLMRGLSKLEPLRETLLNEDASRRATASWWTKGGRPSVILHTDKRLTPDGKQKLKESWEAAHGGADRMGGTAVLEDGVTPTIVQLNAEQMQYVESRKLNREEACAIYDVPPPVVHILDQATYSNITEQMRSMYRDTMGPRLGMFESVIAHHLLPDFAAGDSLTARFALDEVLRGDFETRATAVQQLVTSGVMMPGEARPLFNLDDVGGNSHQLYANAALVPLGNPRETITVTTPAPEPLDDVGLGENPPPALAPAAAPPPAAQPKPTPRRAAASVRQRPEYRAIMGRIGNRKGGARADLRAALVAEHRRALRSHFDTLSASAQHIVRDGRRDFTVTDTADTALTDTLTTLGAATAHSMGTAVATALGGAFDPAAVAEWIATNAAESAKRINAKTARDLAAKLDAADDPDSDDYESDDLDLVRGFFDAPTDLRIDEISESRVTLVGGLAEQSAAGQSGARSKTWRTGGANPRDTHEALDGETVPLGESFSNGMNGPGDPAGGADEVAGCLCTLDFSLDDLIGDSYDSEGNDAE